MKSCCPPKPKLDDRPLLTTRQAVALERTFKTLANSTRLRLLHALVRKPDSSVGEMCEQIGMLPQAVSNQLQRLADRGITESRRDGVQVRYRIVDPCVLTLIDKGWCLVEDSVTRDEEKRIWMKEAS